MISIDTLKVLAGGAAVADAVCPLCGPHCRTAANRNRKTLRIWNERDGFASFKCIRCNAKGGAHDGAMSASGGNFDPVRQIMSAWATPPANQDDGDTTDRLAMLRSLWRRSVPARGTVVERYLRARKCWVDNTPTIQYLPPRGGHPPALLVPFAFPTEPSPNELEVATSDVFAIQLTKLRPDGLGKADTTPNKITIGTCAGLPIALAAPTETNALIITEGVEDALSAALATGAGVWASGGAGRLPALADKIPAYIEHVIIVMDDDDAGRTNATDLASRLRSRGIGASLLPLRGHDLNDIVRADGVEAVRSLFDGVSWKK
jgi:hypothetical protein